MQSIGATHNIENSSQKNYSKFSIVNNQTLTNENNINGFLFNKSLLDVQSPFNNEKDKSSLKINLL